MQYVDSERSHINSVDGAIAITPRTNTNLQLHPVPGAYAHTLHFSSKKIRTITQDWERELVLGDNLLVEVPVIPLEPHQLDLFKDTPVEPKQLELFEYPPPPPPPGQQTALFDITQWLGWK